MLAGLAILIRWLVHLGLQRPATDPLAEEFEAEIPTDIPTKVAVFWLTVGLIVLPISSWFLVEGAIRLVFLVVYVGGIGLFRDIKRVFAYHGAEHMAVHTYEAGLPLIVENVR